MATVEEWLTQMNGTIETLVQLYAAMVVTHPDPDKAIRLLEAMAKEAAKQTGDSPTQIAYKNGSAMTVAKIVDALEFARKVKLSEGGGVKH